MWVWADVWLELVSVVHDEGHECTPSLLTICGHDYLKNGTQLLSAWLVDFHMHLPSAILASSYRGSKTTKNLFLYG
jgi:hypothetical protein